MKCLVAIGECLIELAHQNANTLNLNFAGDTFNTTYYLAKLNRKLKISYCTALGSDSYSQTMLDSFQNNHIDTSLILQFTDKNPGLYLINNDTNGERYFTYFRETSAARFLFAHSDFAKIKPFLTNADFIYLSGISVAILSSEDRKKLYGILKAAKTKGAIIFFDNNYRPQLWENAQTARECLKQFHQLTDVLFMTFSDEALLFGDNNIHITMTRYTNQCDRQTIVIKDGANPLYVYYQKEIKQFSLSKVDNIIDTTGAGDAFNAGFITSLIHQHPIAEAVHLGHQVAAQVIQSKGAIVDLASA